MSNSIRANGIFSNGNFRDTAKKVLRATGFKTTHWVRVVMYERCFEFLRSLEPSELDVLEISAGAYWRESFDFKSYTATQYPAFDICSEILNERFDLIIADQIFEHLKWPYRAGRNVFSMLRPGGYFVIAAPFLIKVHEGPVDCSRWTEIGLSHFLQECGFLYDHVKTASWGNRACVKANFRRWRSYGWYHSLSNEPEFPVMVWAFAQKARAEPDQAGSECAPVAAEARAEVCGSHS
jgi:SAM-dependent methyltransferase